MRSSLRLLGIAFAAICLTSFLVWRQGSGDRATDGPAVEARYVGRAACTRCHEREEDLWHGSHHDLAMQEVTEGSVLGDFHDAELTHFGITSTFFRREGAPWVRTDGPDGELREFPVAYTFGVEPLQQYLVEFPGGRLQALPLAWDSRPAEQGGQRWFHLYPGEAIPAGDELHWTGPNQNWNFMCAECHSTDLRKGYLESEDRYETTWAELDVSCEACHGPASEHLVWAEALEHGERPAPSRTLGLEVNLKGAGSGRWVIDPSTGTAKLEGLPAAHTEVELCARCHSRRSVLSEDYVYGGPLTDTHRPSLLEEHLYHADGQIQDEVYVYGSFLQSRMHAAGVTCSDCHEAHSLKVRYGGANALCSRCHDAGRFDTPEHHFHEAGSPGARCVECHMPATTYMVVDPRRDHSLRVPRPDLTVELGTPNACNDCHADRSAEWAAEAVAGWYGPAASARPEYARALQAGRLGTPGAAQALTRLVADGEMPGIARATALSLLERYPGAASGELLEACLEDPDPLVRSALLTALRPFEPRVQVAFAARLLDDPRRQVRVDAALALLPLHSTLDPRLRPAFERVLDEHREEQRVNADRAGSHLNLALMHVDLGRPDLAEQSYRDALRLDPDFAPAYVNLADLLRGLERDSEGELLLREAARRLPADGDVHHSLGLVLARQGNLVEALIELELAANLRRDQPRYAYVYAVALNSDGRPERAVEVLDEARRRHPNDPELLRTLVLFLRDAGQRERALTLARELVGLTPQDPGARQLLQEIEALGDGR